MTTRAATICAAVLVLVILGMLAFEAWSAKRGPYKWTLVTDTVDLDNGQGLVTVPDAVFDSWNKCQQYIDAHLDQSAPPCPPQPLAGMTTQACVSGPTALQRCLQGRYGVLR